MRYKIILSFSLLFVAMGAFSQDISFPDLPGYKRSTEFQVFNPDNLWDYINGAAETYLAYGFVDLHIAEYKKGKSVIKAEVYRHKDHLLAFGIYSTERSSSFSYQKIGAQGYTSDGVENFYKGNYYIKIRTFSKNEKVQQSVSDLAKRIDQLLEGKSDMPAALSVFPAQGKVTNEEMYINESVLGHKFLNGAFKANYQVGPDNFSIFIFDCKSSDDLLKSVSTWLTSAGIDAAESGEGKYVISDGYNGNIFIAWKDTRIVAISGLSKDQAGIADKYTSEILR
jgi:hypothetical protein